MKRTTLITFALMACLALVATAPAEAQTKLLRFPDIHGDQVVFVYAGDLWTASTDGGRATQLTTHPGLELFPKFSPDGEWVAFTGQYEGDEQVYVVSADGGMPRKLTHYPAQGPLPPRWGYDNQVYGWTPDGSAVLFRSMRDGWDLTDTNLFTVPVEGGLPEALPMPISGAGDFSPDGSKVVYSPLTRDFRSWKRYQGGWAQDLYTFDLSSYELTPVSHSVRTERDPMWIGDTIYFASDRDGTLNLYAFDPAGGDTRQLTSSTTWDVRWPSDDGQGRIVYEYAGELRIFDVASGEDRGLSISVPTDSLPVRPRHMAVADYIEDTSLSPKGERALFTARGDIFSVPTENGLTRNLTRSSDAHDRSAEWSPKGDQVVYISDATGEEQLWLVDPRSGETRQLTRDHAARLNGPLWSPTGTHVAYNDKDGKLFVVEVASGTVTEVADSATGQMNSYSWSPRGGYLAFPLPSATGASSIHVWSAGDGITRQVTSDHFADGSPTWDPDGKYLYFTSDRSFAPQIGQREWNYVLDRPTGVYVMALQADGTNPFAPKNDAVAVEEDEAEDAGGDEGSSGGSDAEGEENGEANGDAEAPIQIDFDGLGDRIARVPLDFGNYFGIGALPGGQLLYVTGPTFYYGRPPQAPPAVHLYSIEKQESTTLIEGVGGLAISADGKKGLASQGPRYMLYDLSPQGAGSGKPVSTDGLETTVNPREEWAQIFDEVWRRFRDYFYVENMHGYDWEAVREQYRPLLDHVGHRSDLNYVLSEMVAELNVGHAYITGGDWQAPERPDAALLGARFELDDDAGRFRIAHIYQGENEEPKYRSPLTELGVDVSVGDYLLAINGRELGAGDNPWERLLHAGGAPVVLTVSATPSMDDARQVLVEPVGDENNLIYLEWITDNARRVEEATDGRVGYIHIPDMGADGIYEWVKHYYPQLMKEGLVIDVRNNGGGNVSGMLIQRLTRELLSYGYSRNNTLPQPYPSATFHGHLVCLLNENSASDGDIFPAMFKQAGLGPLIGKRSWGGVIGITSHGPLIDGGGVNVPEFGFLSAEGEWVIEGVGVTPDIEVDNDPKSVLEGRDPQLEKGIEVVLERIEAEPMSYPEEPAPPVRTGRGIGENLYMDFPGDGR